MPGTFWFDIKNESVSRLKLHIEILIWIKNWILQWHLYFVTSCIAVVVMANICNSNWTTYLLGTLNAFLSMHRPSILLQAVSRIGYRHPPWTVGPHQRPSQRGHVQRLFSPRSWPFFPSEWIGVCQTLSFKFLKLAGPGETRPIHAIQD